jgi:hypothetical protein
MLFKERLTKIKRTLRFLTVSSRDWLILTQSGNNAIFSIVLLSVVWLASYWLGVYGSLYKWTIVPVVITSLLILFRLTVWWLFTSRTNKGE